MTPRSGMRALRAVLAGLVVLAGHAAQSAQEPLALNVSIAVFDPGVPEDRSVHRDLDIFPRIRNIEAHLFPFLLREALARSGGWGAVRVIPRPERAAELLITATILQSDGDDLQLQVRAADATGRVWLDDAFAAAVPGDNEEEGMPGLDALFNEVAIALTEYRQQLDQRAVAGIVEVSLLRYGRAIAPKAFEGYVRDGADGSVEILRLPAVDDPMLERIDMVRSTEYVITDTLDAKYREIHDEIASVYEVWRAYRRKVLQYEVEDQRRAQDNRGEGEKGSYTALRNAYDNYKYHRITEQEQDRLAVAFDTEVGPRIRAMEVRIVELDAWVDGKYVEWRRILEGLFELETALE